MSRIPLFWQRWMLAAAAASIVFGLAFMVMPEVAKSIYETLLFSQSQVTTRFSEEARGAISALRTGCWGRLWWVG